MNTNQMAAFAILIFLSNGASATHPSGEVTEIISFSKDGYVVIQTSSETQGTLGVKVVNLASGKTVESVSALSSEDEDSSRRTLQRSYSATQPGYPGLIAPNASAAIGIVPAPSQVKGNIVYQILLAQGRKITTVATIPVPTECRLENGAHINVDIQWSPQSDAAVIAGGVLIEKPCGHPVIKPVFHIVRPEQSNEKYSASRLITQLQSQMRRYGTSRSSEAAEIAQQLVQLSPNDPRARLALSRYRAASGNYRNAISALWSILGLRSGKIILRTALAGRWIQKLRHRAAFVALLWMLEDQ